MSFAFPAGRNEAVERLGDDFSALHLDTRIQTSHAKPLQNVDPVVVPIYHSTTYRFKSIDQYHKENHGQNFVYQRCGNPTTENVEIIINEIEKGQGTLIYNSGLAAGMAVFMEFLNAGDHVICMAPLYSGTFSFLTETLVRFGVELGFVDVEKEGDNFASAIEKAIKPNTKLIFCEVIANPSMAVPDLEGVIKVVNSKKVNFFIDATFASPYNIQPIPMGADFVMHSCSKYIGGHTDVIGGCVTVKDHANWKRLKLQQLTTGSAAAPFEAALLARGLKTLSLRVERISDNALAIAKHLEKHPKVKNVLYPGLESHPGHKYAKKFLKRYSGMIGFNVGTAEKAIKLVESLRIIIHAVSLGGTESLIEHPLSMSHGKELVRHEFAAEVPEGLLRFSVGIENIDDLIADLDQALEKI